MNALVDTHAHLTDERFTQEVAEVMERARSAGVTRVVTIASNLSDSERAVDIAESIEGVYASVGIHPHSADEADESSLQAIRALTKRPRVVAIGETGLDFHYDNSRRENQIASFRQHLALAAETDLPTIVHARDADDEVSAIVREVGWGKGVLHCFSSGVELLETALDLGWYISFAGMITFPRWTGQDLLRAVPLDRLLIETDSPYLAPVPFRGRRNEPANVAHVAAKAAEIRGETADAVAIATTQNALRFYRIDG